MPSEVPTAICGDMPFLSPADRNRAKFREVPMLAAPITRNSGIDVRPTSGAVGAAISGVDLSGPLAPPEVDRLREALREHGVIYFRDQRLTPEQHIAFAEQFGQININRFFKPMPGYPQIAEVRKE